MAVHGKKISKQAWAITPKIREVDDLLRDRDSLVSTLREVHPEVCFRAWAGAPLSSSKKRHEGSQERRLLVVDHFGVEALEMTRRAWKRASVSDDDILDAFAALRTAERLYAGTAERMPVSAPTDSCGLQMEIVY